MTTANACVRAVAAFRLTGAIPKLPTEPLSVEAWGLVLDLARHERVMGLLATAIHTGEFASTNAQAEQVFALHREAMCAVLLLEHELLNVVSLFNVADIEYRVIKGSSVAHLDYPQPELRSFCDVDILVPAAQFDDAARVLIGHGHRRQFPQPRPGFDRRFSKGATFVTPDGHEIDVHRTLADGPFGLLVHLADLWARSSFFTLGGQPLVALAPEERFLSACFNAALGDYPPRLGRLRDVAELLLCGWLDLDGVRTLSARWRADAVLARAVHLTADGFDLRDNSALVPWARRYKLARWERRALAVYTVSRRSYPAMAAASVPFIPGRRGKWAYLRALAVPDSIYVEGRHSSHISRWRYGIKAIRERQKDCLSTHNRRLLPGQHEQ